ncbi:hypothetical protein [Streptomyces sp. TLI_185]|uniref:hypothetical protein n=1 Tax=Streptomyces sp. TLI_185 TaxID=2485151 RepID=UPI000F5028D1|nr:hypothetical protein [Streptomyces sp. TLI_185]RPF24753.1 hypothetical protein EDD92_9691 [Streptomyces sp. TLI_185]
MPVTGTGNQPAGADGPDGPGEPLPGEPQAASALPDVIPSTTDPDVECVRIGSVEHTGGGALAAPPPGAAGEPAGGPSPCPPGYVPRRRRTPYPTEGKRVLRPGPSERNPNARPDEKS